ncbi:DUF3429 family protein [Sphingopyxis sp.]|uniref:DUF3429 domain-containing protein n=1 Tax=Sphingopyxis sp. TaxID=1908224 RepID=UPI00195F8DC4
MAEPILSVSRMQETLGYAGLLPPAACLLLPLAGGLDYYWTALALLYFYLASILSFLGGLWWGLASSRPSAPRWTPVAAVLPSLAVWASFLPWLVGWSWPKPSLAVLSLALILSPLVDRAIVGGHAGATDWNRLRWRLSIGLGVSGLAFAFI